jgi:hypothetical protein
LWKNLSSIFIMVQISTLLASVALLCSVSSVPTRSSGKHQKAANQTAACVIPGAPAKATSQNAKAIYFMTNDACNSIVALKVASDGTLSDGSITMTGGAGMNGIENGKPAAPDALFSQGAVKVAGNVR